jgi:hypothetical protein
MELRVDTELTYPVDVVYQAYRDRLPEMVHYLPNVSHIDVLQSRREGDVLHLLNEWHASAEIPSIARRVIKPEMLRWNDIAAWHDDGRYVQWRFEMAFMRDQVDVRGRNAFVELGPDRTMVQIRGTLTIDGERFPGLPKMIGRRAAPQIEKFVVSLVEPNLRKTAEAVQRFLDDER